MLLFKHGVIVLFRPQSGPLKVDHRNTIFPKRNATFAFIRCSIYLLPYIYISQSLQLSVIYKNVKNTSFMHTSGMAAWVSWRSVNVICVRCTEVCYVMWFYSKTKIKEKLMAEIGTDSIPIPFLKCTAMAAKLDFVKKNFMNAKQLQERQHQQQLRKSEM